MTKVIFKGKPVDQSEAVIPANNKANFFGYGVYESIRVFRGKPFYAEWHLERLAASAKAIEMELPYASSELMRMIEDIISENKITDALVRIVYYGKTEKEEGILVMFPMGYHFYADKNYKKGMTAVTHVWDRILPPSKTLSLLGGFLGLRKATQNDCVEALLINYKGFVTEGTRSNLFIVDSKGQLVTPPKDSVLEGITRKIIMEKLGLKINERTINPVELFSAKEAFITSSGLSVMPIVSIDGKKIGDGTVGSNTREIAKKYDIHLKKVVADKT
ncbi:MAG: aminotransferase class IV [Candidatus Micrarchaeia archaeon]|jgi:branched-subunit amino acid aminotransferase/4-amino-4-deoxychorismate lyase